MNGEKNRKEMKETYKCEVRREREGRKSRGRDEGEVLSEEVEKEGRRSGPQVREAGWMVPAGRSKEAE